MEAELKSELKEIRQTLGIVLTEQARQGAMLGERCTSRGRELDSLKEAQCDLFERVGSLEENKGKILGAAAVAGGVLGFVGHFVLKMFGEHH